MDADGNLPPHMGEDLKDLYPVKSDGKLDFDFYVPRDEFQYYEEYIDSEFKPNPNQ